MGEFTFFLGLQVQQKEDGIFISQDNPNKALVKDEEAEDVDVHVIQSTDWIIDDRQSSMAGFGEIRQLEVFEMLLVKRTVDKGEQEINATVDGK
ncbi:hypothetical protein Tco_0964261 [Tanacetum coccineum]